MSYHDIAQITVLKVAHEILGEHLIFRDDSELLKRTDFWLGGVGLDSVFGWQSLGCPVAKDFYLILMSCGDVSSYSV